MSARAHRWRGPGASWVPCALLCLGAIVAGCGARTGLDLPADEGASESASSGAIALAAGEDHTCAILAGGGIWCWGGAWSGQLGDGAFDSSSTPVPVGGARDATAIACGATHCCARTDRGVECWGSNEHSELGRITSHVTSATSLPTEAPLAPDGLAACSEQSCSWSRDGEALCWGLTFARSATWPVPNPHLPEAQPVGGLVVGLACAATHLCQVTERGSAFCWGRNRQGQLGDGTTRTRDEPVAVAGLEGVVGVAVWSDRSCGWCADGAGHCWGDNSAGALGGGTVHDTSRPVRVEGLTSVEDMSLGRWHTCAAADGRAYCWGSNEHGQLGSGAAEDSPTPLPVPGIDGVVEVEAGGFHSCARLADGRVFCWGYNAYGQLGDETTADRSSPVEVALAVP